MQPPTLRPGLAAILDDIVALILPVWPELDLDETLHRKVTGEVTAYVAAQIQAMPGFLRVPYALALLGFAWLPLLRYGRTFGALSPALQRAYLARWSDAPIGAMRDFVRLIRSSALFVYFDHALIVERLEAMQRRMPAPIAPDTVAHG
jgi:hypothetical protein